VATQRNTYQRNTYPNPDPPIAIPDQSQSTAAVSPRSLLRQPFRNPRTTSRL